MADITSAGPVASAATRPAPRRRQGVPVLVWFGIIWIALIIVVALTAEWITP